MLCAAISILDILSSSATFIFLKEPNKLNEERYFQIILSVVILGSNVNSGFVWCARWKSKIDFSEIELSIFVS